MTAPLRAFRVLVVDDDEDLNAVLIDILSFHEFSCTGVDSGEAALDYLSRTAPPDLVLLDLMLPGINGFEVLRRVRQEPRLKDVHVWMISTASDGRSRETAASLGASGYVVKPFEPVELVARVKELSTRAQ